MLKRIIFGAFGVLYLIAMFKLWDWFFNLSVLAFALIGMTEIFLAFKQTGLKPASSLAHLSIIIFYTTFLLFKECTYIIGLFALDIMLFLSISIFRKHFSLMDAASTIFGFLYPGIMFMFFILLKNINYPYENLILILTIAATFSTDTFAYFAGITLGKHKLCPEISPKKTIEGSLGGLLGSIIASIILGYFFNRMYNLNINLIHYFIIGVLTGVFSQVGDLTASRIKRQCSIKDFGSILPGHGGILDRFDSLLYTTPVVFFYYLIFLAG